MATVVMSTDLECSICCEPYKTPKVLICGHTFCLDCIERYIGDRTAKFPCPVCRKIVRIPKGGANNFTTNYVALTTPTTSTIKERCPHHSDREVEFYCQTCREGVCSRCMYLHHKDHESVDIESDNTKSKTIEEFSNLQTAIKQTITDMTTTSATLQETSEKLYTLCDEECSKVTKYTEMMIADLRETSENLRSTIKTHFDESQRKLSESKAEVDNLLVNLETKLPSLVDDSCLTILQALPVMTDLGKSSENLLVTLPDLTYSKWKEPRELKQSNIGTLKSRTFYLPKLNDFIFSINDIKYVGFDYYSKNKYTAHGVVWSCLVKRTDEDYLDIYIVLLPSDNPSIASCDIKFTCILIDNTGMDSEKARLEHCFTEKIWGWGSGNFISCKKLLDKQKGFMTEDNQFIVRFEITAIKGIKMKTGEYRDNQYDFHKVTKQTHDHFVSWT